MSRAWNGRQQSADMIARHGAEPEVATDRTTHHSDGAGAPALLLAENEPSDSFGRDRCCDNRTGTRLFREEPANHPLALLAGVGGETSDIAHISIKLNQLSSDMIFNAELIGDSATCTQHLQ